ncbi:hypothetical protein J1N35_026124 [Gossypium stocksii]|uniref:Uncharacterized protein n=1 Tax=Gossypium stocksii TaxID=47602 RepID=A0A9D3V8A1_9ROSI|nr:hypothetical protein J1N35_026124 [Gossypium stocksii]
MLYCVLKRGQVEEAVMVMVIAVVLGVSTRKRREANVPVEIKAYACTTKYEEMSHHLAARGIQLPNFAYDFSIFEGSRRLSDTERGFLLLSYVRS